MLHVDRPDMHFAKTHLHETPNFADDVDSQLRWAASAWQIVCAVTVIPAFDEMPAEFGTANNLRNGQAFLSQSNHASALCFSHDNYK